MLVTCPECGAEISSRSSRCSQCGLPNAGRRSKEYCEATIPYVNNKLMNPDFGSSMRCENKNCTEEIKEANRKVSEALDRVKEAEAPFAQCARDPRNGSIRYPLTLKIFGPYYKTKTEIEGRRRVYENRQKERQEISERLKARVSAKVRVEARVKRANNGLYYVEYLFPCPNCGKQTRRYAYSDELPEL